MGILSGVFNSICLRQVKLSSSVFSLLEYREQYVSPPELNFL